MGSLMPGWNSRVHHLQSERNHSLTKEQITSFWRMKKMEEEELFYHKASYRLSKENKRNVDDGNEPFPPSLYVKEEDSKEPLLKKHGWWICSEWAFLNEPPNKSRKTSYNYVASKHIDLHHVVKGITA